MLKSLVGLRSYSTAGRLGQSDAERFNSCSLVRSTEFGIIEEARSFFHVDYHLPNWEGVRVSDRARPEPGLYTSAWVCTARLRPLHGSFAMTLVHSAPAQNAILRTCREGNRKFGTRVSHDQSE